MPETTEITPVVQRTPFEEWAAIPDDQQVMSSETEIDTASKTAPASEPEAKTPAAEPEEKEELPKGLKKRFSKLTSKIRELEAQVAAGAGSQPAEPKQTETTKPDQTGKPVAANFNTYEEYVEALTDWKLEQKEALQKQARELETRQQTVKTQVEAARARHADYDQVVTNDVPISPAMAEVLLATENGAEIAYHLGMNPEECARIAKLTPIQAAMAIAKIERSFVLEPAAAAETPKPKTATTKAPPPPKVINGTGGGADPEPDPKNYAAWEKWYDRQQKRDS